jgi:hypothetical protein
MTIEGNPPEATAAGEYGATTVHLTKDGQSTRMAFGRNALGGGKVFYGAILLSPEAVAELKTQLHNLGL